MMMILHLLVYQFHKEAFEINLNNFNFDRCNFWNDLHILYTEECFIFSPKLGILILLTQTHEHSIHCSSSLGQQVNRDNTFFLKQFVPFGLSIIKITWKSNYLSIKMLHIHKNFWRILIG